MGKAGERSQYQITRAVWYFWTQDNFARHCRGQYATNVATNHLLWLDHHIPTIQPLECHARDYVLAWAWNGGLDSWRYPQRQSHAERVALNNYATRVSNLYYDAKRNGRT